MEWSALEQRQACTWITHGDWAGRLPGASIRLVLASRFVSVTARAVPDRVDLRGVSAHFAGVAVAADETRQDQDVLNGLFEVGLSVLVVIDRPHRLARQRISDALQCLVGTVGQIRDQVFIIRRPVAALDPPRPRTANSPPGWPPAHWARHHPPARRQ